MLVAFREPATLSIHRAGEFRISKSVRALGAATLVFAVVAVATGAWWFGLTTSRSESIQEDAAIDVAVAAVRVADVLVSQAVVFALDAEVGAVEPAAATEARRAATNAVVALDATPEELADEVAAFRAAALALTEQLATGDVESARRAYSESLGGARMAVDEAATARGLEVESGLEYIAARIRPVSIVSFVTAGLALIGTLLLVKRARPRPATQRADDEVVVQLPVSGPARAEQRNLVIQLPTGPNTLTPRRRHPKVEDLGWLIGEVMKPYRSRGWDMSFDCPVVGADCDPADVREIVNSLLGRAEDAQADRIGVAVRPTETRVQVVVVDDGVSIFGPDSYLSASEPVKLRSSVRTRTQADTAELQWSRVDGLNVAVLDLPRLGIVVPIGADT